MVGRAVTFMCDTCRSEHGAYEAARSCEHQHIVDAALAGFKADLDRIFSSTRKIVAKRRPTPEAAGDA